MIYKYPIQLTERQTIKLPKRSQVLSIQTQQGQICAWAIVDPNEKQVEDRVVLIYGTGQEHPDPTTMNFLATVQTGGGMYVWHVFEELKK